MNDNKIIAWLWQFGHFRNPIFASTAEVTEADLSKLTLSHPHVRSAVASIQALDANLGPMVFRHHGRELQIDGDIGPATRDLFDLPRCGEADYGSDNAATGIGSWPVPGCDPLRKNRQREHSIRVNVRTRGMPYSLAYFWRFIKIARECAAEMGLAARYILDSPDPSRDCEINVEFERQAGSVIGWNEFPTPGTCAQTIQGRIDPGWTPGEPVYDATLWEHEQLGHGLGLRHTRGGIMNPSILRFSRLTWKGDPHERTMRDYFGGVPVPLDDVNPPTPGPDPEPDPEPKPIEVTDEQVARVLRALLSKEPGLLDWLKGERGPRGEDGKQGPPGRDGTGGPSQAWQEAHARFVRACADSGLHRTWPRPQSVDELQHAAAALLTASRDLSAG